MQLDDLKKAWIKEIDMMTATVDFDRVRKEVDAFDRQVKRGVSIELFVCVALVFMSIAFFFIRPDAHWLMKAGSLGMVFVCIFICLCVNLCGLVCMCVFVSIRVCLY